MVFVPAVANRRVRCAYARLSAGAMALCSAILLWSGCSATPETPPSVRKAVNPSVVGIVDKSIRIAISNPNDEAVRVRVAIEPPVPRATYRSSGVAVPSAPTTGFALAHKRTETLAIDGLTNGKTYTVKIETISRASGLPHTDVWNKRIALVKPRSFRLRVETGAAWSSIPIVDANGNLSLSGEVILSWTNPNMATQIRVDNLPRGVVAHLRTLNHNPGAKNNIRISGLRKTKTYTFNVVAENYFGSATARLTITAPDLPLPIVMWQAAENVSGTDAVARPNLCQEILDAGQSTVTARLRALGYRKAILFGSSPDYDYRDLATDPDAFGDVRNTVVIAANASRFASPAPFDGRRLVIDDFVREIRYGLSEIAISTPPIASAVTFVVSKALNTKRTAEFWTFSSVGDGRYNAEKFGIGQFITFSSDHDDYIAISAGSAWHGFHASVLCLSQ